MSLNPVGDANQVDAITTTASKLNQILGGRIDDAEIHLKTREELRERAGGLSATGFWSLRHPRRQIWLLNRLDEYPVVKTLAHEAMHVLDDDWLTKAQRTAIRELMNPKPRNWKDSEINGDSKGYAGLPFESFAVYGSAAIGLGFERPAYLSIFIRKISDLSALRLVLDRDTDTGTRGEGGRDEEDDIENVPVGPDTVDELQDQLNEVERKLTSAKFKANKIGMALNQGDIALAREKANEIEGL
jgi:hypothetical protein